MAISHHGDGATHLDHYSPHTNASFEGYYSRFTLESNWSVCLIVSAVHKVDKVTRSADHVDLSRAKPFYIVLTCTSPDSSTIIQKEYWPTKFDVETATDGSFEITFDSGRFGWDRKLDIVSWDLDTPSARFKAATIPSTRTPWTPGDSTSTPAGFAARLPLPIQWHVHSLSSECTYDIDVPGEIAQSGRGYVHYEKNWAASFPRSYTWLQARDHQRGTGVTLAGGTLVPGVEAWLVGYHGKDGRSMSYWPFSFLGLSLSGLSTVVSYPRGRFEIDIKGWFRRLKLEAQALPGTFFRFAAPVPAGHVPDYCTQSYATTVKVEVHERRWPWNAWTVTEKEELEQGALEFGGDCFKQHHD